MRRKAIASFLALILCLALASSVMAMSSTNYRLDWLIPLTGGGGATTSTHYSSNLSIGQTVIGSAASPGYQAGMGYWHGISQGPWELYLPFTIQQ